MTATPPRQQLIEAIARLNEPQIRLILQFIQTLQPKPNVAIAPTPIHPHSSPRHIRTELRSLFSKNIPKDEASDLRRG